MSRQSSLKNGSIRMTDCIILAGAQLDTNTVNADEFAGKYIICADRGVSHAQKLGVQPDLIVGDFDSLGYIPKASCKILQFKPEKDDTDLMIALKQAIELGFMDIKIYAALGGRLDHTFASIQALAYALDHDTAAQLVSDTDTVAMLDPGEYAFERKNGFSLSLFSYSQNVSDLNIKGAKYEAENVQLSSSFPLGISNEIVGEKATVSFKSGRLLVIRSSLVTTF